MTQFRIHQSLHSVIQFSWSYTTCLSFSVSHHGHVFSAIKHIVMISSLLFIGVSLVTLLNLLSNPPYFVMIDKTDAVFKTNNVIVHRMFLCWWPEIWHSISVCWWYWRNKEQQNLFVCLSGGSHILGEEEDKRTLTVFVSGHSFLSITCIICCYLLVHIRQCESIRWHYAGNVM